jgi:hypothetical protein
MAAIGAKLFLSFFALPFLLAGVYMLKATYEGRQRAADVEGREPTDVAGLQPGDGPVVVEGTARARGDDLVEAPMLDAAGVHVVTRVEEYSSDEVGDQKGTAWDTVYATVESVPFVLDDGTGEIPVEVPDGGDVKLDPEVFEAEAGEAPPEPVQRWLETTDLDADEVDPHRAYKQAVLEDDETAYAMGEAVVDDDGELVLGADDYPGEFVVSDMGADELADEEGYGRGGYAIGAVLFAVGAVPLAFIWLG